MTVRFARTAAVVIVIACATLGTSGCTEALESVSAPAPIGTAAAIEPPTTTAASAVPVIVPLPTSESVEVSKDGLSPRSAVPVGQTLMFVDRNAVGDKGTVTVLGVKDWDATGPGDDSGVAVEVELTLAADAFIPPESIVTTEPWTAVDKNGGIYRASWLGSGDPSPVYPHKLRIDAGETVRGWILIGTPAGVDDGSRPSKTSLTIRYGLSDSKFLFWKS